MRSSRKAQILTYAGALALAILFVIPLVWMLSTSLKSDVDAYADPGIIPARPTIENFAEIFDPSNNHPVFRWFLNSILVSTIGAGLTIVLSTLSGYAFARLEFRGRRALFWLMIGTFLLPGIMFLIPQFVLASRLGLYNTIAGLVAPGLASVFGVFMMRQFFLDFPTELEEAAALDGASVFRALRSVVIPLSGPPIATLAVISFLGYWNDYLWPIVMCQGDGCTLAAGLAKFQGQQTTNYGLLMAGATVAALPILAFFVVAQRWIVRSIAFTGSKG